jgi:DNA-binding IclR family transcriptional regulator
MKSLNKAFDILEIFLRVSRDELRLSELAKISGFKVATVNRIASVLVKRGYLSQPVKRGKYSLGTQLLYLGNVIKQKARIREIARPYMIELSQLVKETVILANWNGKKVYFVDEIYSEHALRIIVDKGSESPLYCTAVGKIFLAYLTEAELEEYFNNTKIQVYTPNTITDLNLLKSHLEIAARKGVAYDDEEYYAGTRSMVAGIRDDEGQLVSCVGVLAPSVRLTRTRMAEIEPDIKRCALEISLALGYREPEKQYHQ